MIINPKVFLDPRWFLCLAEYTIGQCKNNGTAALMDIAAITAAHGGGEFRVPDTERCGNIHRVCGGGVAGKFCAR